MTKEIPFSKVLEALLDDSTPLHPRYLYRLSDLGSENLAPLAEAWEHVSPRRRQAVMEDLFDLAESDLLLSFEAVCNLALADPNPYVRTQAIRVLNEYENPAYLSNFLRLVEHDPDDDARAAAASALAAFVYQGEVDEIPPERLHTVEECLLGLVNSQEAPLLRQKALEALGFSSRPEVNPLIEAAYHSDDPAWLASALNAMGRAVDARWKKPVLDMLDHLHPAVRAEAASAAGELGIAAARRPLIKMLDDHDADVRAAAIWALSQIGGEGVRSRLERLLAHTEEDDEVDLIQSALDNLSLTEEGLGFTLLDLDEPDLEDEEALIIEEIPDDEEDEDQEEEEEEEEEDVLRKLLGNEEDDEDLPESLDDEDEEDEEEDDLREFLDDDEEEDDDEDDLD